MERLIKLREKLVTNNLDGMLVGSTANRRYLSEFTGSAGWVLVSQEKAYLSVDFRYVQQAESETSDLEIYSLKGDITCWIPGLVLDMGVHRLGIESDHISVSVYQSITEAIKKTNSDIHVVPVKNVVESLRVVKNDDELKRIERAAEIADAAMLHIQHILRAGITEKQLAWQLECFMRENESQLLPFEIIVASGQNAALPHAQPSDKTICEGEPVTIDLGARFHGYCSDITRTFVIGKGDDRFYEIYNIVLTAQLAGLSMIESGMDAGHADSLIRGMIDKAGYGELFGHSLGHGVGLEIHEAPRLGMRSEDILEDRMVFTIEPGIYIPGWGGIRIEDTVVLKNGRPVSLTHAGKDAHINGG